jgi:phage shock protein C
VRDRLYRSRTDRILFGVAGGFAEWLDVDPSLVRIVWALLVFAGGAGFLLYVVAAIVIPEEPSTAAIPPAPADPMAPPDASAGPATTGMAAVGRGRRAGRARGRADRSGGGSGVLVLGAILVLIGGWFLVRDLVPGIDERLLLPGILILIGLLLVVGALRRNETRR